MIFSFALFQRTPAKEWLAGSPDKPREPGVAASARTSSGVSVFAAHQPSD